MRKVFETIFYLYDLMYRLRYGLFSDRARAGEMILFHKKKYTGVPRALTDGIVIPRGAPVIAIHFHNTFIKTVYKEYQGDRIRVKEVLKNELARSLSLLRKRIAREPAYLEARACMGETILGSQAKDFGFDVFPVRLGRLMRALSDINARMIIARARGERFRTSTTHAHEMSEVWISVRELGRRYPERDTKKKNMVRSHL